MSTILKFYDGLLDPSKLFALLAAVYTLLGKSVPIFADLEAMRHDANARLYGCLLLFTLILGVRLLKSIWLARLDYQALPPEPRDLLSFAAIAVFVSGVIPRPHPVRRNPVAFGRLSHSLPDWANPLQRSLSGAYFAV